MTKTLNQIIFFPPPKSEYFFRKKPYPPFQVKWSFPNKANKTLGFMKRNIHGCTQKVKQHTFTTMVRPTLEYASTCWDPQSKDLIGDIEQVQ